MTYLLFIPGALFLTMWIMGLIGVAQANTEFRQRSAWRRDLPRN